MNQQFQHAPAASPIPWRGFSLNRAIGAPVSGQARFKMRLIEPGRRPAFRRFAIAALLLAGVSLAAAQSNGVPGPRDYTSFAHFVADRNIFDPNRQPHSYVPGYRPRVRRTRSAGAPDLQLVGTMSYEKGLFAFFNGNSSDLKKALQAGDKIADFTVTEITVSKVVLESTGKTNQLTLNVGEGLRQENGKWLRPDGGEMPASSSVAHAPSAANAPSTAAGPASDEGSSAEPATPASASEPNDVLKRLMQQREKENQ